VVIDGVGAVRDGEVIEGDYEQYVPRLLVHAPEAKVKVPAPAKQPDTLPAPPEDETVEMSAETMAELVKDTAKPKKKAK
jgi:hypothetical protein